MSDVMLRFSLPEFILLSYVFLGPLLLTVVLAVRALGETGRVRMIAAVGLAALLVFGIDALVYMQTAEYPGLPLPVRLALVGAALAGWLATVTLARRLRRLDLVGLILPLPVGLLLAGLEP